MSELNTYLPPGVYVEDVSQDVGDVINPLLNEELLCIVAPAQGYQTASQNVVLSSTIPAPLFNTGVSVDSSLVVTTPGGSLLNETVDYTVSTDSASGVTSLLRLPSDPSTASPGGVLEGGSAHVDYHFVDDDYYSPKIYNDYSSISRAYGTALTSVVGDPPVVSPLSLAAKIAFENGASRVMVVPVNHSTSSWRDDFKTSYDLLVTNHQVSVLAVVFPETEADTGTEMAGLLTDLRLHVDATAANGFGRLVITSAATTYDEETSPFEDLALGVANKRIVVVYPTRFNVYNDNLAQSVEVSGAYAGAAVGGRLTLNSVERGVTREVLNTLTGLPASIQQKMTRPFKDNLAANGVLVVETNRSNRLVVRHGLTTDMSSITTREISLVRVADVLFQDIQVGMENSGLIGDPIDEEMSTRVKSTLAGILEQEMGDNVIVSYANLLVRQQALPNGDPSVIECQFSYKPAVPLNYITVRFTLDLNTGELTNPAEEQITA